MTKPKFTKTNLPVIDYLDHRRAARPVPLKRAMLIDNNKYTPKTARRDKEEVKARSRLPITSTFYRPRNGWSDAQ